MNSLVTRSAALRLQMLRTLHSYDQRMPNPDLDDIRRRLDAGERLSLADAARLLGRKRDTVYGWTRRGKIPYWEDPMSRYRELYPEDVRRLLAELRQEPDES